MVGVQDTLPSGIKSKWPALTPQILRHVMRQSSVVGRNTV